MKFMTKKATRPLITSGLIASTLLLSACGGTRTGDNDEPPAGTDNNQALFRPLSGILPLPNNIFFAAQPEFNQPRDGTLNIPSTEAPALAANELDGWSTVAPIEFDTNRPVDIATVTPGENIRVFNVCITIATGQPNRKLGPDGELVGTKLGDDGKLLTPDADYLVVAAATDPNQLLIKPLRPLRPAIDLLPGTGTPTDCNNNISPLEAQPEFRNGYIAVMTNGVKSTNGDAYTSTRSYQAVKQGNVLFDGASPTPTAISFGLITATDAGTMESIRQLTTGIEGLARAFSGNTLEIEDIILSTIFNTQSVGATLSTLVAGGRLEPAKVQNITNTQMTTADVLPALFDTTNTAPFGFAAIYTGTITLPYYLTPPTNVNDRTPLEIPWCIDTPNDEMGNPTCGATTLISAAGTVPLRKNGPQMGSVTMPVLITIPTGKESEKEGNADAPTDEQSIPTVIFQHGITQNRSNLLLVADALGKAGLAGIAIDHPLHGITATDPRVDPTALLRIPGVSERTFDLDLRNNDSEAPGPDGRTDSSGAHYFNLSNLLVGRDNLRQSVIDVINLAVSIAADPNNTKIDDGNGKTFNLAGGTTFLGHSLGGIVGGTMLGVLPPALPGIGPVMGAGTLAMPGGGVAKLLDGSASFGPNVTAGLAAQGVAEGTPDFETFLSFAQQAIDTVDPVNWAPRASALHRIHVIEVVGDVDSGGSNLSDQVVPNSVPNDPTIPGEVVVEPGPLGGTDPLIAEFGFTIGDMPNDPNRQIFSSSETAQSSMGGAVRFSAGNHASIISPKADCPTTLEMQTEMAIFLKTNGATLTIGASNPADC